MTRHRGPRRIWSEDDIAWLIALWPDVKSALVAEALGRRLKQCHGMAGKLGLRKSAEYLASADACRLRRDDNPGADHRFKPGMKPWNTGMKGWTAGGRSTETRFKKGRPAHEARNYKPIGSLRLSRDGYLERKITDDQRLFPARRWVGVHRLVWEAANGPVPAGHAVAFLSGQRTTIEAVITLDRLELVSRAELMRRNSYHTNYPPEIRRCIQLRGALVRKINKRSKNGKDDNRPA